MPELPEVETIVRGLKELIKGRRITAIKVREAKLIAYPSKDEFINQLKGKKIIDINRRGKYILIALEGNKNLVIHLRMTGRLLVKGSEEPYYKHTHIIFRLDDDRELRFNNMRKFGRMYLIDAGEWQQAGGLAELGPEPLSSDFTLRDFTLSFKNRRTSIKALLLNQKFIAGLGNIYVDEALFLAGISPLRKADSLTDKEIEKLYHSIREVLRQGIESGGTTFSDYLNARGGEGSFQKKLHVYQREGKDCHRCQTKIIKERVAGRGTHYCPGCQR